MYALIATSVILYLRKNHCNFINFLQRFGTESVGASAPREMRYVREELNEMEHQLALLQRENKEKDRQLAEEREDCDRVNCHLYVDEMIIIISEITAINIIFSG